MLSADEMVDKRFCEAVERTLHADESLVACRRQRDGIPRRLYFVAVERAGVTRSSEIRATDKWSWPGEIAQALHTE